MFQDDLQQFISTAELKQNGFSNYQINQMVSRGILLKVNMDSTVLWDRMNSK